MTVLIPQDIVEVGKKYLRDKGYEVVLGSGRTPEAIERDIVDCDAVLARTSIFSADALEAAPKLKVIGRHGVGFDNIDVKRAEDLGIWVTNTPEALSVTVAEHALGLMLAIGRCYIQYDKAVRAGDFDIRNRIKGVDFAGKTLGIVGLGRIGREVARRAEAGLGMEIIAFDPYVAAEVDGVESVGTLEELLKRADFVSLHLPSAPETRGLIGKDELAMMRPTAYLINTARGTIVDEAALVEALSGKRIAGAAIDVYEKEPPDASNPLFTLDNVVVMPHVASNTEECVARMALHSAQGIHEVLSGKKPTWPVNHPEKPR